MTGNGKRRLEGSRKKMSPRNSNKGKKNQSTERKRLENGRTFLRGGTKGAEKGFGEKGKSHIRQPEEQVTSMAKTEGKGGYGERLTDSNEFNTEGGENIKTGKEKVLLVVKISGQAIVGQWEKDLSMGTR